MVLSRLFTCVAILLIMNNPSVKSLLVEQAVIKKNIPPGNACSKLQNMPGNAECFILCLTEMSNLHAFSRRVDTGECRFCKTPEQTSSAPIDNSTWETFYPGMCGDGFTYTVYKDEPLCLSYIVSKVDKVDAKQHCMSHSSDLVSIGSTEKQKMVVGFIGGTSILDIWFEGNTAAGLLPFVCEAPPVFTTWRK
ncbi:uncharacterized protein LOC134250411 [Saccostrea cucullata]|uniref:uncharacterized protein LOC134250411 n=1 Tax=Saccostrea cuccullata TaxID=36930 RepID=UPI002ED0AEBB